jgi:hypothetical protein
MSQRRRTLEASGYHQLSILKGAGFNARRAIEPASAGFQLSLAGGLLASGDPRPAHSLSLNKSLRRKS